MTIALVAHVAVPNYSTTSSAIDTTGASLLVAVVAGYGTISISDSYGNTWTELNVQTNTYSTAIFYVAAPTVGSGHTFTTVNYQGNAEVAAFSGVASSPFDQQTTGSTASGGAAVTIQAGSITPSVNGALVVAGVTWYDFVGATASIDSGFTITDQNGPIGGSSSGGNSAFGYLIQTTAGAVNPIWNCGASSQTCAATIASFIAIVSPTVRQSVYAVGRASTLTIGAALGLVHQSATATGKASTATVGVVTVRQTVHATGLASTAALGSLVARQSARPGAVASTGTIGTPAAIRQTVHPTGLGSTVILLTPALTQTVHAVARTSASALGIASAGFTPKVLTPSGIAPTTGVGALILRQTIRPASAPGVYREIRDQIRGLWSAGWQHPEVPVYWRLQDVALLPDPATTPLFVRNELLFGREQVLAFGGGRLGNQRMKYGTLIVRVFADIELRDDSLALDLLAETRAIFRGARVGDLSFIGSMSSSDADNASESTRDLGNWAMMGSLFVWQYRFTG